jgi:hypothetical protein
VTQRPALSIGRSAVKRADSEETIKGLDGASLRLLFGHSVAN